MPIFDYKCKACDETFEKLVLHADEKVKCKRCGNSRTEKLFSCTTNKPVFKGGGFYETEHGKQKYNK